MIKEDVILSCTQEVKRCIYCDHKYRLDEDEEDLYYHCPSCRLNNIDHFIATKW